MVEGHYVLTISGRKVPVTGSIVVGRSPTCDVVLAADFDASRRHAVFTRTGRGVMVEDLGSTNGTFVGSERISVGRLLNIGDLVRVGSSVCRLTRAHLGASEAEWDARTPALGVRLPAHVPGVPEVTFPVDMFDVLERVTLKQIQDGNYAEAEDLSASHLFKLLSEARAQQGMGESRKHIESALRISSALSKALATERWANYLVALLAATGRAPSDEVASVLTLAVNQKRSVDMVQLAEYCSAVEAVSGALTPAQRLSLQSVCSLVSRPSERPGARQ